MRRFASALRVASERAGALEAIESVASLLMCAHERCLGQDSEHSKA